MHPSSPLDSLTHLRADIRATTYADETTVVNALLAQNPLSAAAGRAAESLAIELVELCRAKPSEHGLLDAFLLEYSLSTEEGVALMCLAEALLRVPDSATIDRLISEKILEANWRLHRGKSDKLFVNAATWGMILTGDIVRLDPVITRDPGNWLQGLVNRLGEPAVRFGIKQAMKLMGQQYVLGSNIDSAIKRGRRENPEGTRFSFDMLGEGARSDTQAERYFLAYRDAIRRIGAAAQKRGKEARSEDGISIKLSALHPCYHYRQRTLVMSELLPRVRALALEARDLGLDLSLDAEESERLDIQMDVFEALALDPELRDWHGLGFVLQAYQKRATALVDWLSLVAEQRGTSMKVRLVKGAYWDAEIKRAQVLGLRDYPVFTRKINTDLSYQVCAAKLLAARDRLYPQFATHNAYTAAMILELVGSNNAFEFQRLHGMGELLYKHLRRQHKDLSLRVYAPVGHHADLLPYLVRRLLENGANCSFVNQFLDPEVPAAEIVDSVEDAMEALPGRRHTFIPLPRDLFHAQNEARPNAWGMDTETPEDHASLLAAIEETKQRSLSAGPLIEGCMRLDEPRTCYSPADRHLMLGECCDADAKDARKAVDAAHRHQPEWQALGMKARAALLDRVADALEERFTEFTALISLEAGRSLNDGISEVREAVDFCRYYALQARSLLDDHPEHHREWQGRGVFVCISPWNFPLAIFVGQIAAALVVGNTVIAKPAEQTPLVAVEAVKLMHASGIPSGALSYLPGEGEILGPPLLNDPRTAGVAFTGSNPTAQRIQRTLVTRGEGVAPLIAETGGQNAMLVDSTALPEQVVDDVIQSAFQSAGQRCSALRVLFLQQDIADRVLELLRGAVSRLRIGLPWELSSDLGPVIDDAALAKLLQHADRLSAEGRSVALAPAPSCDAEGHYIQPRVFELESLDQLPEEIFGPILHVVRYRADQVDDVIRQIRNSGFALTLGVHSRLKGFARYVIDNTSIGNNYINRNMIGAVVGVQPFGGLGKSGTGFKAGGPHYLLRFTSLWPVGEALLGSDLGQTQAPLSHSSLNLLALAREAQRTWQAVSREDKGEKLRRTLANLPEGLGALPCFERDFDTQCDAIVRELEETSFTTQLPGPTGERNSLTFEGRGRVVVGIGAEDIHHSLALLLAALAAGNSVVLCPIEARARANAETVMMSLRLHFPENLLVQITDPNEQHALLWSDDIEGVAGHRCGHWWPILAEREGARLQLVDSIAEGFALLPFFSEKTVTDNIVATGGNAQLLNLEEPLETPHKILAC